MAETKAAASGKAKVEKAALEPETPDTPSGLGLKAAEGKDGEAASEAYHAAKKEARWG